MSPAHYSSALTRVRPFFSALVDRSPTGEGWLAGLLELAPNEAGLENARCDPGALRPTLVRPRRYHDGVLHREIQLLSCFEHAAPPSGVFLRWLIENPEQLEWPERAGVRRKYGERVQRMREALIDDAGGGRDAATAEALLELEQLGPDRSRRMWWAFEGFTEVDCWLETDRLLLLVEGTRNDQLAESTAWFPGRSQLARLLEVAAELAERRTAGVLLMTEEQAPELSAAELAASTPHLEDAERTALWSRYLGQVTWRDACDALGVDFGRLPDSVSDLPM
jgi:hypothetical protein